MDLDESLVEQMKRMWSLQSIPIHPSAEAFDIFRAHMARASDSGIMVFGATVEMIDMAVELGAPRIVGMDIHAETLEAMRRLATTDWESVELFHANWLDLRSDLVGEFGCTVCDGGLLFLEYPSQWRRLFEVAYAYLEPGGQFVSKTFAPPPTAPPFEDFSRDLLARFESEKASLSADQQFERYRSVATALRVGAMFGIVGENGAVDQKVLGERLDRLACQLLRRHPDPAFRDVTEAAFLKLCLGEGQAPAITAGSPGMAKPLLRDAGFDVDIVFTAEAPVANANYMIIATK